MIYIIINNPYIYYYSGTMVSVIIVYSKKLKINPDNVATPLAGKFQFNIYLHFKI